MRSERVIGKRSDFRRLYRRGRRAHSDGVTVFVSPRDEGDAPTRLGLSVRRSAGTSVARNRIRRRVRHAFGEIAPPPGYDVVVEADAEGGRIPFQELVEHLGDAMAAAGLEEPG